MYIYFIFSFFIEHIKTKNLYLIVNIFKLNYLYIIIKKRFSKIITKCIIHVSMYNNECLETAILI